MRWVGIDEAGYGPNLGPLIMVAVIAEGPGESPPNLWNDLAPSVSRAQGPSECLWVDDSKAIYQAGKGRERLFHAALATLLAAGHSRPSSFSRWLAFLDSGSLDEVELLPWLEDGEDPDVFGDLDATLLSKLAMNCPLQGACWRIVAIRAVVVGPARFNRDLEVTNSKAGVHFLAFCRLMTPLWNEAEHATVVRSDKHGGRHFYLGPLSQAFSDAWIDRGVEGPELSRYTLRDRSRRLVLEVSPRADSEDGLVALASITAKAVREAWMTVFNAFWLQRVVGLKPTAGYPTDARRFRDAIEPLCCDFGLSPHLWWRER